MNEAQMNEKRVMEEQLAILHTSVTNWSSRKDKLLTKSQLDHLFNLAAAKRRRQRLNRASDRTAKKEIHQDLRNAFADIVRMIHLGFIGGDNSPWKDEIWHKDFPKYEVWMFVKELVRLFGDEYANEIANGIQEGLIARQSFGDTSPPDITVQIVRQPRKSH